MEQLPTTCSTKTCLTPILKTGRKQAEAAYDEQRKNPSPGVARLMKLKGPA